MSKRKPFPKTEVIRKALQQMPADRPREPISIYAWLLHDGRYLLPEDLAFSLDDVEQLLPRVLEESQ